VSKPFGSISLINTAGADPRIDQNDLNIAGELAGLAASIINYPFKKKGIVIGNLFGGASVLSFPPQLGGEKLSILKGCKMGVMDAKLIRHLLSKTPRLLSIFESKLEKQRTTKTNLYDLGIVDRPIFEEEISTTISNFLLPIEKKLENEVQKWIDVEIAKNNEIKLEVKNEAKKFSKSTI